MLKTLSAVIAASFLLVSVSPAIAGGAPKTKEACEKAKMKWDEASKKCSK